MCRTRFVVKILKAAEGGRTVTDLCREHGMSCAALYKWKAKFRSMEASDILRMKELEAESAKLEQMFAELSLGDKVLRDVIEKKL